jgi:WD40 repeat protein
MHRKFAVTMSDFDPFHVLCTDDNQDLGFAVAWRRAAHASWSSRRTQEHRIISVSIIIPFISFLSTDVSSSPHSLFSLSGHSETCLLSTAFDGTIRLWDLQQQQHQDDDDFTSQIIHRDRDIVRMRSA